ncbi:6-phosphofructokinase [Fulvivirgaceae bacterium PWU4]|uniref:ATP-dependent 6-phosphofructokinase n=1 Tax=Chryseosolibacter histidini TaxID=2782349 RepID=A0AAP2DI71_9BACT|nr:6-phosphofructokinase [Chryseosolibacter histidini]MBT1696826.1 6-phosphofructokinase [Chryseosolibacter histidini]
MENNIRKIGVFTSGGDAPGMNAAIRAVVRACTYYKKDAYGIMRGYEGMIEGDLVKLGARSVGNIIQRGGTILKSARSEEFRTAEGRKKAYENLKAEGIEALVAIGGDGTFTGLHKFYEEYRVPSVCIPGTIDNDLPGTDYTIGYDTATNTAVEAIDRIRDTALSHNRLFFVEVMGRNSGYIAINSGIAGGATGIVIPEENMSFDQLYNLLGADKETSKKSNLIVVAEGSKIGDANTLARKVAERSSYFDIKVTILGHLQRGGAPTYFDRVLASKMGIAAVEGLMQGQKDVMVGIKDNKIVYNDFNTIMAQKHHEIDSESLRIAKILSI